MELEQRAVIFFYGRQNLGAKRILRKLVKVYADQAYTLGSIKYWLKKLRSGITEIIDSPRPGRPIVDLAEILLGLLAEQPYASTKSLAKQTQASQETVKRVLIQEMGFQKYTLKWVPHDLSQSQKLERVTASRELLRVLQENRGNNFADIITGDESWFCWHTFHSFRWAQERSGLERNVSQKIQSKKSMLTVFFNGLRILTINCLPQGQNMNSDYFINNILTDLSQHARDGSRKTSISSMRIHMDNCKVHNSIKTTRKIEELRLTRIPHPPYSPDIAPSDFWLFGYLKEFLRGAAYPDADTLFAEVQNACGLITQIQIVAVFNNWIERLQWVIDHNGEYYIK
jgi:histone-lysine N-methyltransferase SETMAR